MSNGKLPKLGRSGLLATVMVDVTNARANTSVSQNPAIADAGTLAPPAQVGGVWFSGVYGVSLDSVEAVNGVDEAFAQSPYIGR